MKENQAKRHHNLEELDASLAQELKELGENIAEANEIVAVTDVLAVTFDPTGEVLYIGLDDRYKRYMPIYVAWRDTIQECFNRSCEGCSTGGLEGSLNDGLVKFRASFNPTINRFIGGFDLPVNKLLFKTSEYVYKLRKQKK